MRGDPQWQPKVDAIDQMTPSQTGADPRGAARAQFIDAMKGIGIFFVVLGHTLDGTMKAGLFKPAGLAEAVFYLLYLFHMPLFFVLSALYVQDRINSQPKRFLHSLWQRIAWPFLVWTMLQMLAVQAAGALVNSPGVIDGAALWRILWAPPGQYWFLHCLFIFHLLAFISIRLKCVMGLLPLAAAAMLAQSISGDPWPVIGRYIPFLVFYAFGVVLTGRHMIDWSQRFDRILGHQAITASLLLLFLAAYITLHQIGAGYYSPAALGAQTLGVAAMLALVKACHLKAQNILAWLGRRSMPIFLLHVMVGAGVRITLHKSFDISNGLLILAIATVAGLLVPCIIFFATQHLKLSKILALG